MKESNDYYASMSGSKRGSANKIFSLFVTVLVICLLVFVGPVDALFLGLSGFKNTPYDYGETVNFIGRIDINSNERVDLQSVGLEVNGKVICTFDVSGNKISGCFGVNISLSSNNANFGYGYGYGNFNVGWNGSNSSSKAGNYNGYGYGYGYGYGGDGGLVYNISIETPKGSLKVPGVNEMKLVARTSSQLFNSRTERIVIQPPKSGNGNFLFGYDDTNVLFWGKYNSSSHTLAGEIKVLNDSSFKLSGIGNYYPKNKNSGDWEVLFYNPDIPEDVGVLFYGTYNQNEWILKFVGDESVVLKGKTFVTPE